MIGITGATGRLGSTLMRLLPDAVPIGRSIPRETFSIVIHCAVSEIPHGLDGFNLALRCYCNTYRPKLINVGSCWQLLAGETYDLEYSKAKRKQSNLFPEATEVIPYWVFGRGKGFVWDLVQALRGFGVLHSAGAAHRDFVSVDDVARDIINAFDLPAGMFGSYTDRTTRPFQLAEDFGLSVEVKEPFPSTVLEYPIPNIGSDYRDVREWVSEKIEEF